MNLDQFGKSLVQTVILTITAKSNIYSDKYGIVSEISQGFSVHDVFV